MSRSLRTLIPALAALLSATFAGLSTSHAVTLTFQEGISGYTGTRDTFLGGDNRGAEPTTPHGSATTLTIYEREISLNNFYRSLVGFDLTSVDPGTEIAAASLTLWVAASQGTQNVTNSLYAVALANSTWTEGQATWNNRDQSGPTPWAGSAGMSTAGTDYIATAIDAAITPGNVAGTPMTFHFSAAGISVLEDWINNPANNAGFFIRQPDGTMSIDNFQSSEGATAAFHPLLAIETFVAPPVPEPSTGALLGLGAIGLAWRLKQRVRK